VLGVGQVAQCGRKAMAVTQLLEMGDCGVEMCDRCVIVAASS
jgi:hypothetical protein